VPILYFAVSAMIPDVLSVALGDDGAIPAMKSGAVFIDNSTVSADVARQVYDAAKAMGVHTLDAPVSGWSGWCGKWQIDCYGRG
jgi:3-hydroxyisobutyrate dehydrogenase-like beta-hydroxyacid dehydrogenase